MNKRFGRCWTAILGGIVLWGGIAATGSPAQAAAANPQSGTVPLEAKLVNGEVYVKAAAVPAQLGGSGTYDAKTQTYRYTPAYSVPEVVRKVSPSVVAIIGKPESDQEWVSANRYNLAHGTGVIVKKDGWIVTNAHVVDKLNNAVVVTLDGKSYDIVQTFTDELSDLALIRINAADLQPAVFAENEELEAGEPVVALGTPVSFSLRNSATAGIVSGLDRGIDSFYKLIQTDAAINPGNSGGPLVNMKGEVIGINSLKFAAIGVENMGFSIPASTVKYVLDHFDRYGKVRRASLGIDLEESWAAIVGLPTDDPLTVRKAESAEASKAGIRAGDVLYSVDDRIVTTIIDLNELLKSYLPGQQVKLMMQSDGDLVTRRVTLSEGE